MIFNGTVKSNAVRVAGASATRTGKLEMTIASGGTVAGTLSLDYMSCPELEKIKKLAGQGHQSSARRYRVKIEVEEII